MRRKTNTKMNIKRSQPEKQIATQIVENQMSRRILYECTSNRKINTHTLNSGVPTYGLLVDDDVLQLQSAGVIHPHLQTLNTYVHTRTHAFPRSIHKTHLCGCVVIYNDKNATVGIS